MSGYHETDDYVDMARDEIAEARACTEDDHARIAAIQHSQRVTWEYIIDDTDWRSFNGLT